MLIAAKGVSVRHGGTEVLSGVTLEMVAGEIVTIVGPNGSGKSTLLRALIGAVPLSAGEVRRKPGLRVGYVPQKLALDAGLPLSVARFLSLPLRQSPSRIAEVLARTGADGLQDTRLSALSGGTMQRVLLARALLDAPELLILDEPTQGLDQPGEASFYRLIEQVRADTGAAVLMVSHDLHVVMSASDRVICLNRHVCCEGTPSHVSAAPEYRALFGLGTGGALALYRHDHDHHHHDHDGHRGHHHHDHAAHEDA